MKPAFLPALLLTPAFSQNPYNEKPSYARSRDFDLRHIKLELSFDLPAKKLNGAATLGMAPLAGDLRELVLDSAALNIESVTAARWRFTPRTTSSLNLLAGAGLGGLNGRRFVLLGDIFNLNRCGEFLPVSVGEDGVGSLHLDRVSSSR